VTPRLPIRALEAYDAALHRQVGPHLRKQAGPRHRRVKLRRVGSVASRARAVIVSQHSRCHDGKVLHMLTITDRHARDRLRAEAAGTLNCVSDLELYAESKNHPPDAGFARLRRRVSIALELLDCLGWDWSDERDVYCLTLPSSDLAWWATEALEGIDENLRECAGCFAQGGRVWPDEHLSRFSGGHAEEGAEILLDDARELADIELDSRAVLVEVLEQLEQNGVSR
jgi:hypothetical protein